MTPQSVIDRRWLVSHSANISPAIEVEPADASSALQHFEALLRFETDCWDVQASLASPEPGFVLPSAFQSVTL
jgi:hypothetical protein